MTTKKKSVGNKKPPVKKDMEDIVFDDDTDSSEVDEDELKAFQANLKGKADSDEEEEPSSGSDESGTESTDADVTDLEEAKARSLKRAHVNAKLSALQNLLGKSDEPSSSENEEDTSGGEEEEQNPEESHQSGENEIVAENEETDGSEDSTVEEEDTAPPVPKKRKVTEESSAKQQITEAMSKEDKMRAEFREKIRHLSMEELQQMKQDIGTKAMDKMMGIGKKSNAAGDQLRKSKADFKRENKNRPRETSSKKTVGRFKDVVGLTSEQKSAKRDPRFDSLCGEFDAKVFKDSYKFVDDIKARELKELKARLKDDEDLDEETRAKIKYLIQRNENQVREKAKLDKRREVEKEQKRKNRELAKEGKRPQFMSKRERQNVELVDKFEELKSSGKLENYMRKKSKKNLAKDRKRLKV